MPKTIAALAIVLLSLFGLWEKGYFASLESYFTPLVTDDQLVIEMIDVGQGDSIFITQGGESMLIDTNTEDYYENVKDTLNRYGVSKLDFLVATHPHSDHIGSMCEVLEDFGTEKYCYSDIETDTYTYKSSMEFAKEYADEMSPLFAGDVFTLGDARITVLSPSEGNVPSDLNNASLVLLLEYGDFKALFTGDAEKQIEQNILPSVPDVDVLKVGHHGSYTSSSEEFLAACKPETALISLGEGNQYGFPHQIVLDSLNNIGCEIFRTDLDGSVTVTVEEDGLYSVE